MEIATPMFNFEKPDVWTEALALADIVYRVTGNFPEGERFGLTVQMRRAAVSISSNIAEGSSRHSKIDFARFVEIAAGSLFELVSQSFIAKRQKMLGAQAHDEIYLAGEKLGKMLSGLRKHLTAAPR